MGAYRSKWNIILKDIIKQEVNIKKVSEESLDKFSLTNLVKIVRSKKDLQLPLMAATEEFVIYEPTSVAPSEQLKHSGSRIFYQIEKIVEFSDSIIKHVSEEVDVELIPKELVMAFRVAFSHLVRRHAIFHYLVERGSMLLDENRYIEYRRKIYEKRKNFQEGNLEEALADAYALSYAENDIEKFFSPRIQIELKDNLIDLMNILLGKLVLNENRPPGYKEAKLFVYEFRILRDIKTLEDIQNLVLQSATLGGSRALDGIFKGLSWLFKELTLLQPADFRSKRNPPAPPYSIRRFLMFLENFRRDDTLLSLVLTPPSEDVKK